MRAEIVDRQAAVEEEPGEPQDVNAANAERSPEHFSTVLLAWHDIRDQLEKLAADPSIDGRTAAKYQRIDRRNYADLINSMTRDNNLPDHTEYLEAARIWARYRSRRMAPTAQDTERLRELARRLVGN